MRDSQMFNILESLKKVNSKKQNLNESKNIHTVSTHVANDVNGDGMLQVNNQTSMRNIIDSINETLEKNQRKVNQMPGTHTMGKLGKNGKHPAGKYLVGGEEGDVPNDKDSQLDEMGEYDAYDRPSDNNSIRTRSIDNMKSKAKQGKKADMRSKGNPGQANIGKDEDYGINFESRGRTDRERDDWEQSYDEEDPISPEYNPVMYDFDNDVPDLEHDLERKDYFDDPMNDRHYESVEEDAIGDQSTARKQGLHKDKSSLTDVFKSMSETDEDREATLEQELHTEINQRVMTKNKNGKYNLNSGINEDETSQQLKIIQGKIKRTMDLLKTIPKSHNSERAPVLGKMKELQIKLKALKNKKQSKEVNPNSREYNANIPTHDLY